MARHQQQERVRRIGQDGGVRRSRPSLPRRRECFRRSTPASQPKPNAAPGRARSMEGSMPTSNLTLPATQVRCRVGADGDEALGVCRALCRHECSAGKHGAEQGAETAISRHRLLRETGARQHHRNAAPPALVEQVRPEFRFHDDGDRRLRAIDEPAHGPRRVVRQITHGGAVAEQRLRSSPSRRRRRRHDHGTSRMAIVQGVHDRGGRGDFPQRHGVQPDRRARTGRSETETLAEARPVEAVPQTPPQHHREGDRAEKIDQHAVEETHGYPHPAAGSRYPASKPIPGRGGESIRRQVPGYFHERSMQPRQVPGRPRAGLLPGSGACRDRSR